MFAFLVWNFVNRGGQRKDTPHKEMKNFFILKILFVVNSFFIIFTTFFLINILFITQHTHSFISINNFAFSAVLNFVLFSSFCFFFFVFDFHFDLISFFSFFFFLLKIKKQYCAFKKQNKTNPHSKKHSQKHFSFFLQTQ